MQTSKVFNPDISVIGNFVGAMSDDADQERAPSPFELAEAEVAFQAVVDPYARADFFFAFGQEGAEVEEGYITFPTLPGGLLLKVGKMRASFGKVNQQHVHAVRWTDRPLVTQNLLGGEEGLSDAGLSVSRLFPNPVLFLEATAEVYRGENEVFQPSERKNLAYVGRLRGYRDITEATNLDVGASLAAGHAADAPFATSRLFGVDATFRYRPLRRSIYRQLLARTELVWSRRRGGDSGDPNAFGAYVSGEYQLARRWFGGVRLDTAERPAEPEVRDRGASLVLTFSPSEFSLVRGQFRRTRYGDGITANEGLVQFLFSIGAHGAHPF